MKKLLSIFILATFSTQRTHSMAHSITIDIDATQQDPATEQAMKAYNYYEKQQKDYDDFLKATTIAELTTKIAEHYPQLITASLLTSFLPTYVYSWLKPTSYRLRKEAKNISNAFPESLWVKQLETLAQQLETQAKWICETEEYKKQSSEIQLIFH